MTGNKGEWSEVYALFKLLSDREVAAGDDRLNKVSNLIFPIIKILRDESGGTFDYSYKDSLVIVKNDVDKFEIPIIKFSEQAKLLLKRLQANQSGAFEVPGVEEFLATFHSGSIKASSVAKSDIRIVLYDNRVSTESELGFSIKSQLGGASTLLNAGKTTNFVYQVIKQEAEELNLNSINGIVGRGKIKRRLQSIIEGNHAVKFVQTQKKTFGNNLSLIDSQLPEILSSMVKNYFLTDCSTVVDLIKQVNKDNPLQFDMEEEHPFYEYKIKRLLTDIALGMMPSKPWNGELDATGGYLVVKNDGEIVCYHIYNRNDFEDYLVNNTKFETASSGRHDFGKLYKVNGEYFFKLNLQIRFLS